MVPLRPLTHNSYSHDSYVSTGPRLSPPLPLLSEYRGSYEFTMILPPPPLFSEARDYTKTRISPPFPFLYESYASPSLRKMPLPPPSPEACDFYNSSTDIASSSLTNSHVATTINL
ncbi:uncharacterized protein RAG0_03928 [Rhynchosporium agropyri]|uniref:Uncharacterized protein n=1 Tax=Rhynchosporium agropyri TaxID=914238 RepID=A0A1E1K6U8_9HELO|nr:uncharacterized protein RAG0_03928 [Rhynchosporium agropyri]